MKRIFYSEVLDKYFDDEKECTKAEVQYQLDKQDKERAALEEKKKAELAEVKRNEELAATSKEKKALSDAIEKSEVALTDAQNEYRTACEKYKEEVRRLKSEYINSVKKLEDELIKPTMDVVKECQEKKYEALKNFNDRFGTYTVKYTGEKAYNEMRKTIDFMNNIFNNFWF